MINSNWEKRDLKYTKRKERLDKDFEWTKEGIHNLSILNENLFKLQEKLIIEIKSAYELFSNLEKNGMTFLHGFKVIGSISFEKEIVKKIKRA